MPSRRRGTGGFRLIASASVLLFAGVAVTAASFTDRAVLNLGNGTEGSGLGNPHRFDIAVRDAGGVLQDAAAPGDAVVLPVSSGAEFSEATPLVFDVRFENRDPGIAGDLTFGVFDPDPSASWDLFDHLVFTVYLQGNPAPVARDVTAAQLNAADISKTDVQPGGPVDVRLEALIAPGTGLAAAGHATQLGVRAEGESR